MQRDLVPQGRIGAQQARVSARFGSDEQWVASTAAELAKTGFHQTGAFGASGATGSYELCWVRSLSEMPCRNNPTVSSQRVLQPEIDFATLCLRRRAAKSFPLPAGGGPAKKRKRRLRV